MRLALYLDPLEIGTDSTPEVVTHLVPSTFWLCLRDARVASGRDADTGQRIVADPPTKWLGAVGYFILLDQIGEALSRGCVHVDERKGIRRALALFADLDQLERKALYSLRCAFAHEYSLVHDGWVGKHLFRVVWDETTPLLRLPASPWTGEYDRLGEATEVNLLAFTDLGERVVERVFAAHRRGDLVARPSGVAFDQRYFVTITDE